MAYNENDKEKFWNEWQEIHPEPNEMSPKEEERKFIFMLGYFAICGVLIGMGLSTMI